MKYVSLVSLDIDPFRLAALGMSAAVLAGFAVWVVVGDLFGQATFELDAVISLLVMYVVISAPKRVMDARRVSQSKEAVLLASISTASARVVGSRNRVLIMLRSGDEEIAQALKGVRKALYLGVGADEATATAAARLASYSAINALLGAGLPSASLHEEGEEARGLETSGQMAAETKLPIFMTATFFTPIMLLLYAVFAHLTAPERLAELVALEVIILDLAFYVCS